MVDETLVTHASSHGSGIAPVAGGDGNLFVVPGGGDGDEEHFAILSVHPLEPLRIFAPKNVRPGRVLCVAVDGDVIASGDSVGNVCLWSVSTGERIAMLAKAEENTGKDSGVAALALHGDMLFSSCRRAWLWREERCILEEPAYSARECPCVALGGKPGDEVGIYGGAAGWGAVHLVPRA